MFLKSVLLGIKNGFLRLIQAIGASWFNFFFAIQTTILLALGIYVVYGYFAHKPQQAFDRSTLPPTPVEVQEVYKTTFEQTSTLTGLLFAPEYVALKAEIEGRVKSIHVVPNTDVKKGDVLFTFEDAGYKAELQEAEARLRLANAQYKRDANLRKSAAKSEKEVEESAAKVAIAQAEFAKRKAVLDRTVARAPFDGRVGIHSLSVGAYVRPGEDLLALTSTAPLRLEFCVPEKYTEVLSAGDEVKFVVDNAPGREFMAYLSDIDPQAHPTQHCVRCRAQLKSNFGLLRHGLYARVRVKTRVNEGVIVAPQSAVETRGVTSFVYTVENNKAKHKNVRVGGRSGGSIEILSGLSDGDKVVTAGQMRIQDGFPVFVIPPKVLGE